MPLSCSCYDSDYSWCFTSPDDYSELSTSRRKRCCSCRELISVGAVVAEFSVTRATKTWVEEEIYGEDGEIEIASKYLCEKCADLYFSFQDLGFSCVSPDENMVDLAKQYHRDYN